MSVAALPWTRLASVPFVVMGVAMGATFWEHRADPAVAWWFVLAGALMYGGLALLLNVTELYVRDGIVIVRHRPVPWPGRRVPVENVAAIDIVQSVRQPDRDGSATPTVSWVLVARLRDGRETRLTMGFVAGHRFHDLRRAGLALAERMDCPFGRER